MIQEQFPAEVDYQTEWTRLENQGNVISCTTFGVTSALECILARAGNPMQLSPKFLWYYMQPINTLSVQTVADTLERVGTCLDSLHPYLVEPDYPFNVIGLLDPPSLEALEDAKTRLPKGIKPVLIASGKEGVMRALCQGSALTIIKILGGSLEHCTAIIGYNAFGVKIHDSGNNIYYQPWSDLDPGGNITQLYRWEGLPLVPHPDYIEGDIPTLIGGVLSLPKAMIYVGFPEPSIYFKNIHLRITSTGQMTSGNDDVQDIVFWHSRKLTLYIPKLIVDSTILKNVKMVKPIGSVISVEEA